MGRIESLLREAVTEAFKEFGIDYPEMTEQKDDRKFTQAEVDQIVRERLAKAENQNSKTQACNKDGKKKLLTEIQRLAEQKGFSDNELKNLLQMIIAYRKNNKGA